MECLDKVHQKQRSKKELRILKKKKEKNQVCTFKDEPGVTAILAIQHPRREWCWTVGGRLLSPVASAHTQDASQTVSNIMTSLPVHGDVEREEVHHLTILAPPSQGVGAGQHKSSREGHQTDNYPPPE